MEFREFNNAYLRFIARNPAEKEAIVKGKDAITFGGLWQGVDRFISLFSNSGIEQGGVVLLEMLPEARTIAQFLALMEMGTVVVLLPVEYKGVQEITDYTGATNFIAGEEVKKIEFTMPRPEVIEHLTENKMPGFVLLSSGSTGKPKLVVHSFERFSSAYLSKKSTSLSTACMLLIDHIGGLNTLLNALATGSTLFFPEERKAASMLVLILTHQINILPASPSLLNLLLIEMAGKPLNFNHVKVITFGTEPISESLLQRVKEAFPSARLIQTFGTSETGIAPGGAPAGNTRLRIDDSSYKVKIVDGELWIRSETSALGYAGLQSESFTAEGWFRTGDVAEIDEDGFLTIKGRKADWINVGGEKVLPNEIEELAMQLDEVIDCTAFPIPNAITGQAVGLTVVTFFNDLKELKRKLLQHLRARLQSYKVPVKVTFADSPISTERFKKDRKITTQ